MSQNLTWLDFSVIGLYFLVLLGVVLYITLVERKADKGQSGNVAAYFLGGKNLSWAVIGASLFASNIGTEHLVGLAGAGAAGDFAGCRTVSDIKCATEAGSGCTSCHRRILTLLQQSTRSQSASTVDG